MSAECIEVQQVLSMTQDGEPVGPDELRRARIHCAECEDCAQFESALKLVRRLRPQTLPDDLVARIMAAVEVEVAADRAQAEAAHAAQLAAAALAPREVDTADVGGAGTGITLPRTRRDWTMWGGWMAAAAVLLIAGGIAAVRGAYFIASPPSAESDSAVRYSQDQQWSPELGASGEAATSATKEGYSDVSASGSYVVFDGWVYRFAGSVRPLRSNSPTIGVVSSALDTGGAIEELQVFGGDADDKITIRSAEDTFLGFELVWRSFRGRTYGLRSGPISKFGDWPTLPSGVPQPDDPSGSPVLERSINDDAGVAVFRLAGQSESSGFAVAPGTAADDPAAGNPGWTWWEPFN